MRVSPIRAVRWIACILALFVCFNVMTLIYAPKSSLSGMHLPYGSVAEIFRATKQIDIFPGSSLQKLTYTNITSTETCKGLQMKQFLESAQFQKTGLDNESFVHSAYYEVATIRIIGLQQMALKSKLFCQIWYSNMTGDPLLIGDVDIEFIPEDHGRRYTSAYFICKIPDKRPKETPLAVSVVRGQCDPAVNVIPVQGPGSREFEFTMCVSPLNYKYSRAYELVEMIEMNKILGAQRLVFYNHSTGPNVDRVFEYYQRKGEVEVVPWHLPIHADTWPPTVEPEVHYFAQLSALNDCLYRYKNRSHYLVFTDLDEFIVPRQHSDWKQMVNELEKTSTDMSIFQAQCTFFRKEWPKPAEVYKDSAEKYNSVILQHTVRETDIFPHGTRSKYIVNPSLVKTVGVHNVWSFTGTTMLMPPTVALLHHYRTWERPNDNIARQDDLTAVDKYGKQLVVRLESVWSKLKDVPLNINISSYGPFVS